MCWDRDAERALETAHRIWGNEGLPRQLAQVLPRPRDFMDVQPLVPRDVIARSMTCGDDAEKHIAQVQQYVDAGLDEVYVQQIGRISRASSTRGARTGCRRSGELRDLAAGPVQW